MWWHILVHQVMLVVFATFCIIDIEPGTNLGKGCYQFRGVVYVVLFVPHSFYVLQ